MEQLSKRENSWDELEDMDDFLLLIPDKKEDSEESEWSEPTTELSVCDGDTPVEALLIIVIEAAEGLPAMDYMTQRADPYCVIKFGTRVLKSTVKKRTRSPVWNEEFRLLVSETELNYDLIVELWDWDRISANDLIGTTSLCIAPLLSLSSKPLHPFALPIKRAMPRIPRLTYQKTGGILHLKAALVRKAEAEQIFWDKFIDIAPIFEGERTALTKLEANLDFNSDILPDPYLIWQVYLCVQKGESLEKLRQQTSSHQIISRTETDKTLKNQILVQVRETGKLEIEHVQPVVKRAIKLLYANKTGRAVTSNKRLKQFLERMTTKKGIEYENPASVKYIPGFIQQYNLNMDEFKIPQGGWTHFNDFFYRELIPGVRPIAAYDSPEVAVSPADCRMLTFPYISQATDLWIKGENFTLLSLLRNEVLAQHYEGGSMLIARLAPQDYHRFHSPVCGTLGQFVDITGAYYTVNPIAVNHPIDIFTSNRRVYSCIHSGEFGMVCYIAVGATLVGSIRFTREPGEVVNKGDELGYFAFGGSTIIVLFEKREILFDQDLIVSSLKPLEMRVKMGECIGTALNSLQFE